MAAASSSVDSRPTLAEELSRVDGCTKSALATILVKLKQRGDLSSSVDIADTSKPEAVRKRLREPYKNLRAVETPYGPLIKPIATGVSSQPDIEVVNPLAYLYHLSDICHPFADLMLKVSDGGNRQLRIVMYIDSCNQAILFDLSSAETRSAYIGLLSISRPSTEEVIRLVYLLSG